MKFRIFSFEPAMCGLFVLDLDRKNGVDGVAELQKAIDKIGFELQVEDLPAQTRTPNNGLHVYFRYDGNEKFMPNRKIPKLPAGVEVKHSGCLVTVPGSVKGGVQYRFAGSLEQAPELPEKLIDLLCRPGPQKNTKPQFQSRNTSEISLSLFSIQDILQKQGEYPNTGNRNRFCHEFTRFALKKGYETFEIIDYLRTIVDGFDTPEVNGIYAVMSAYKHFLKGIRR